MRGLQRYAVQQWFEVGNEAPPRGYDRIMTRRTVAALIAAPLLALSLTACGTSDAKNLADLPAADRDAKAASLVRDQLDLPETTTDTDIVDFLQSMCDLMDTYDADTNGYTAASIQLMKDAGYTAGDAPMVNTTAASAYCPEHMDLATMGQAK